MSQQRTRVQRTKLKALVNVRHVSTLDLMALAVGHYIDHAPRPSRGVAVCMLTYAIYAVGNHDDVAAARARAQAQERTLLQLARRAPLRVRRRCWLCQGWYAHTRS